MNRTVQVYYQAIFGMVGGLIAWLIIGQIPTWQWALWPAVAFIGAGTGLFIGGAIGAVQGVIVKKTRNQTLRGIGWGVLFGMPSGLVGLVIGQAVFLFTGGGLIGRTLGWMLFGLGLGISQTGRSFNRRRMGYGAGGGTLAGLVGGLIYEGVTRLFLAQSGSAQMILGALGLGLIGASLGGITGLSIEVMERIAGRGLVIVKSGPRTGMEVPVVDLVTLGRNDGCNVYLPGDAQIAEIHARIGRTKAGYSLEDLAHAGSTTINASPVSGPPARLQDGDTIQLGHTRIEFREQQGLESQP